MLQKIHLPLFVAAGVLMLFVAVAPAHALTMTVSDTCGLQTNELEVEIWDPPGGYVQVNDDKTVTADVPEGTKLFVYQADNGPPFMPAITGNWTPAEDGGTLPIECTP